MQKIATFFMFSGEHFWEAYEAISYYVSLFDNSSIDDIEFLDPDKKIIKTSYFTLLGQSYMAFDSEIDHKFNFTPSISSFVTFDNESELEKVYKSLSENGLEMMPLGDYGFSKKFGWVQDRFGISWQLCLR